jgi:Flp pilus assembly protein TadG
MRIPSQIRVLGSRDAIKNRFQDFLGDENGSAIVEFVIFALPLFIPLALYLTSVNQLSTIQSDANNYARQLARVYVTSTSKEDLPARIEELNSAFEDSIFSRDKVQSPPQISVECSTDPCLSPNSRVSVNIELTSIDGKVRATARASQSVDAWRSS